MRLISVLIIVMFVLVGCNSVEKNQNSKEPSSEVLQEENVTITINPTLEVSKEEIVEATISPTPEAKENITISWEFEVSYDEDNFDIPKTKVYLVIKGETNIKEYVGEYIGTLENYSLNDDNWGFPEDSIIACFGWYAGSGDLLSVVREEPGTLVVKHKVIAESEGDPEIEKELENYVFENIRSIQIDEDARIETIN